MFNRVTIIGLGLIGGSIGLALRREKMAKQIAGYDLGQGVSERARKIGAIDDAYESVADAVSGSELVILATPVGAVRTLLQAIAPVLTQGTVVTDVSSTKSQVISWAEEFLPPTISFVGGHPMAGKEVSGVEVADPDLFKDCIYCLTPTTRTRSTAVSKVAALVETLGARVRFLEPAEHDGLVAGVSHLPFLVSTTLMSTVADDPTWGDAALLASSGFRDTTRLAAGNPEMYRDICLTNSAAIVRWLDTYVAKLSDLRDQIAMHDRNIDEDFTKAQQQRQQWQVTQQSGK
ncbi:prephenate dehydrogenase [Dictyobacter kobayashii]|uniref:Prephenate dehydrogenase n=1 Tax=Dictyobacter kobayashii TaxID=2014872 RepID=A0A402ABF4_9CHLR|nr:prephenate dehydrogenase/arogenate dehydrogenase family protein [Dictyobacter kobayashii]GCE16427.1 prephenate dehydrogenase [Dictyobacter kobayashii]